jgi:hypothetical protein
MIYPADVTTSLSGNGNPTRLRPDREDPAISSGVKQAQKSQNQIKPMKQNRLIISVLAALLCGSVLQTTSTAQNLQGTVSNGGFVRRTIPLNGEPILQSYYFRFTNGDHHFKAVGVEPRVPSITQATLGFADHNSDDPYFYNITFARYFGSIVRGSTTEFGRGGRITFPVNAPADRANFAFVIRGFYVQYRGDDHHIQELGIQESNGRVTVALNDHNDDDPFQIDLQYAYLPRTAFSELSLRSGVNARGGERTTVSRGVGLIRGFHFNFTNDDHHIKELGVLLNGAGRLEVYFGDDNGDDPFNWNVAYGILKS